MNLLKHPPKSVVPSQGTPTPKDQTLEYDRAKRDVCDMNRYHMDHSTTYDRVVNIERFASLIPRGYARYFAVQVKPINSNHAPVTVAWLCNERSGRRVLIRVSLRSGECIGYPIGLSREYQKHVKLSVLHDLLGIGKEYSITLKGFSPITPDPIATHTPTSSRIQKACSTCAGQQKPHTAKLGYHEKRKHLRGSMYH